MNSDKENVSILLVDDHAIFRKGIKAILSTRSEYIVRGEAANGFDAIEKACQLKPDIIFMDIDMPEMNGLEATRVIKQEIPETLICMLTVSDYSTHLFEAIKSGASGYLLKNLEPEEIFEMIDKTMRGEPAINGVLATRILTEFSRLSQAPRSEKGIDELSEREIEVLELVVRGYDNREIARVLSITHNTVKSHLSNIMEKLHLRNRVEAAVYAVSEGLVNYRSSCKRASDDH